MISQKYSAQNLRVSTKSLAARRSRAYVYRMIRSVLTLEKICYSAT